MDYTLVALFVLTLIFNYAIATDVFEESQKTISDKYKNALTPSSWLFAIWGFIYFFIGLYIFYYTFEVDKKMMKYSPKIKQYLMAWLVLNIVWNFLFIADMITLSLVTIIIMTYISYMMYWMVKASKPPPAYRMKYYFLVQLPFMLTFAWMTIAMVENMFLYGKKEKYFETTADEISYASLSVVYIIFVELFYGVVFNDPIQPLVGAMALSAIYNEQINRSDDLGDGKDIWTKTAAAMFSFLVTIYVFVSVYMYVWGNFKIW